MDVEKTMAAAKAAYPELWPDSGDEPYGYSGPTGKATLARRRQAAIGRIGRALEAYGEHASEMPTDPDDDLSSIALADFAISLPEDAAMVQQVLTTVTYIDQEGKTAYVVRTMGEGLLTSWLGMSILTQNYLLGLPKAPGNGTDEG